ncbi:VWA domain-containing protein, partial [Flavobacterium sp. TAB 87]|uniref:vWA domain-containing protein n=1 Tax=Flavobacterium sp. TAB 87 TaxID=1729581 RepID=UPI000B23184D
MKTKTTLLLLLFLFTSTIYSQSDTDPDNLGGPVYVGTIPALTVPSNDAKLMRSSTSRFKREAVNTTNLEWPNAGAVHIEKTAQATTFPDKWKINVMVEGKNIPKTTDVILVIDDSGSMGSNSKMTTAKEAAKKFVNELLTNSTGIRVAIVTINSEKSSGVPQIDHAFTDDRSQLLNSINSISAAGGTNLQGGFYAARSLMDISVASKKVVILLSDGEPTYSYKSTPSISIDMNCENKSNFSIVRESFEREHLTVSASNYLNVTGNGSNFKFALYSKNITCGAEKYDIIAGNHGIPTAYEAALLINSGVDVYTIGFGVSAGGEAEKTLQKSQSKGYYPANTSNIQNIYSAIRSNISYAATNAILTDPMSGYIVLDANVVPSFSVLPIDTGDVVISKGTINFTQNGYVLNDPNVPSSGNSNLIKWKITWNIGTVSELGENMNYFVTLAPNTNPTLLYDANEQTYMDYTDVNGNTTANQKTPNNFTIPKVSGGKGSIEIIYYAVNSAGEPINSSGTVVNKENALKLIPGNSNYFKFNNETALTLNQSYSVNPDASYQSNNNSYQLFCSFGDTDSTPTATDPNKKVWFGYFIDTPPIASDQTECSDGTATQKLTATATTTTGTIKWYLLETGGAVINDPVQIGVGTTTYYAEVSDGSCTTVKRTPVKLTIKLSPVAVITSSKGLELNCTIPSTTLTASGGTSYLWSNGETTPSITVTTADKFSVIVTNENGCTATTCATTTLDTTVPLAVITSSNGLELNCTIPSTILTVSGGTSYLWSNGETTPSITVTTADKFSVIVTNENGCTATTCATTTLDNAVP